MGVLAIVLGSLCVLGAVGVSLAAVFVKPPKRTDLTDCLPAPREAQRLAGDRLTLCDLATGSCTSVTKEDIRKFTDVATAARLHLVNDDLDATPLPVGYNPTMDIGGAFDPPQGSEAQWEQGILTAPVQGSRRAGAAAAVDEGLLSLRSD